VDNFVNCTPQICNLGGRSGSWYAFASVNINQTFAVSVPPSGWVDKSCAAWNTGGPITGVTVTSSYAGIGATLNQGAPYNMSASGYSGVTILMESGQQVTFVVKDALGGYFGANMSGGGSGSQSYPISFASLFKLANSQTTQLDLTQVVAFEFDSAMPTSYGFAIHSVILH
jgi:hypothetical protein